MIGQTLDDRYAILRLIGQGGMGAVYEALHLGTNRKVAVKVILSSTMNQSHVARFEREARIVGSVDSQHITTVYDTGRDRATGSPYIAMELLSGEDADALVERLGALPTDLALRVAYQACLGLGRAHAAGIVHRDIKTANLFLHRREGGERVVKILDFGIAKSTNTDVGDGSLTREGTMLGSPLYMSPEQAKGGQVDPRSDVWSMGITLYELLTARRPNEHIQQLGELIVAICTEPAPWLQDVAPRVPFEVAAIVRRAISIDPAGRFADGAEMAAAIKELLPNGYAIDESMLKPLDEVDRISVAPRQPGVSTNSGARAISTGTGEAVVQAVLPAPRSKAPMIAGALLALALGGGGAALVLRGGAPKPVEDAGSSVSAPPETPKAASTGGSDITPIVSAAPSGSSSASAAPAAASASSAPLSATSSPAIVRGAPTALANTARPATSTKPTSKPPVSDDETSRK